MKRAAEPGVQEGMRRQKRARTGGSVVDVRQALLRNVAIDAAPAVAVPTLRPAPRIEGSGDTLTLESIELLRAHYTLDANTRNVFARDAEVVFNDDVDPVTGVKNHFYQRVSDGVIYESVSSCIKRFFAPFNQHRIASSVAAARNRAQPPPEKPVTVDDILAEWKEAREGGTEKHLHYETFFRPDAGGDYTMAPPGFYAALMAHPTWDIYANEKLLHDPEAEIAGTADVMFRDRGEPDPTKVILGDWKNTKEIRDSVGDDVPRGTHPLTADMFDTNYLHYVLQLNWYRYMLEKYYGLTVTALVLFNFPPAKPHLYQEFQLPMIDMAPFAALFPWRDDDPRHALPAPECRRPIVPAIGPEDARGQGPTTVMTPVRGSPLPPTAVWMGRTYKKNDYDLTDQGWKAPYNDYDPQQRDLDAYEAALRQDGPLLRRVRDELYGKTLVCWCRDGKKPCHARMLARYANALGSGAIDADEKDDISSSPFV